jgi:pimeloyl-ACP methyl ester carboxylesterase
MKGYDRHQIETGGIALTGWLQPGPGPVVVMQHGLCGDALQPAEVFPSGQGFRHAVLDCRGHGSSPHGDLDELSLATFSDDVAAMITRLNLRPVAVGGISMGAAIALRLAVWRPELVRALILVRPAWVIDKAPANMAPNAEVGACLAAGQGADAFLASATARHLAAAAPDNLASLKGFFDRSPRDVTAALLTRISADGPGVSRQDLAGLAIPVLILATEADEIHPVAHGRALAAMIPGAELVIVPPKAFDRAAHVAAIQREILSFLKGLA